MATELKVIMFTDQIDSTKQMAGRTPAEMKRIAREQDDLTADVVSQCRGAILKDTGDGHMIEFRACRDAVLCGFVIQQRVGERNAAQPSDTLKFALHIGIDSGEAVVLENGDLRANAANLAARVSAKGPEGEVYFTEKVMRELNPREAQVEPVGAVPLKGVAGEVNIYRLVKWLGPIEAASNPFIWRGGITKAADFVGRNNEQRHLRAFLQNQHNVQIVGPNCIGKTSLLRQIERQVVEWEPSAIIAYMDLQDPHCFTQSGWLRQISRLFAWSSTAKDLEEFVDGIEAMITAGKRPVLCLDEFEELTMRRTEFTRDFFLTLRSCGQKEVSIITASQQPLGELIEYGKPSSPFHNIFPKLQLGPFAEADAKEFVTIYRPGIAPFTNEEKQAILEFAKGNPLALQVASFQVAEERAQGGTLHTAIRQADDDMRHYLPNRW